MSSSASPNDPTTSDRPGRPRLVVNWVVFIGLGAALGFVAGVGLDRFGPAVQDYGAGSSGLFLGAFGAVIGALIGGAAGVLADLVVSRR